MTEHLRHIGDWQQFGNQRQRDGYKNQDYGKYKFWWRKIKDILVIDIHLGNNDKEMATRTKIMVSWKFYLMMMMTED